MLNYLAIHALRVLQSVLCVKFYFVAKSLISKALIRFKLAWIVSFLFSSLDPWCSGQFDSIHYFLICIMAESIHELLNRIKFTLWSCVFPCWIVSILIAPYLPFTHVWIESHFLWTESYCCFYLKYCTYHSCLYIDILIHLLTYWINCK